MKKLILEGRSITPAQWTDAQNRKAQFMSDATKKAAHARGEVAALKELQDISIILGRPVQEPQ